jgi:hypothetical protein
MKLSFVAHDFLVACGSEKQRIESYAFMAMTRHGPISSVSSSIAGWLKHKHNASCQTVINGRLDWLEKFEAVRCYKDPQVTRSPW